MAYTNNPSGVPRDAVRLEIGDIDPNLPILSDSDYDYFLTKNASSVRRAALDAAKTIVFKLSRNTHERIDQLEIWGDQWARSYIDMLRLYISDPNYSVSLQGASPFAGGISKSDIVERINNSDNQTVRVDRSLLSNPDLNFNNNLYLNEPENPFRDYNDSVF